MLTELTEREVLLTDLNDSYLVNLESFFHLRLLKSITRLIPKLLSFASRFQKRRIYERYKTAGK